MNEGGRTVEDETKDENQGVECLRSEEFDVEVLQRRSQLTLKLATSEDDADTCQSDNRLISSVIVFVDHRTQQET